MWRRPDQMGCVPLGLQIAVRVMIETGRGQATPQRPQILAYHIRVEFPEFSHVGSRIGATIFSRSFGGSVRIIRSFLILPAITHVPRTDSRHVLRICVNTDILSFFHRAVCAILLTLCRAANFRPAPQTDRAGECPVNPKSQPVRLAHYVRRRISASRSRHFNSREQNCLA
jgi:hypothetical protein